MQEMSYGNCIVDLCDHLKDIYQDDVASDRPILERLLLFKPK